MASINWRLTGGGLPSPGGARAGEPGPSRTEPENPDIGLLQLQRLAGAVLSKSADDLAALFETNPELVWEWRGAFRQQKLEAEAEARFWSAAAAALATIPGEHEATPVAAE